MKLVIVESPTKCTTIGRYLGDDYKVMATKGHIRDLSTRGKGGLGIDIEAGFVPDYVISPGKGEVIDKIRKAVKKSEEVYLATDPDREGEAISWHLVDVLNLPVDSTKRLQFHEITRPSIQEAMANPGLLDMNIVKAQETRRMEDRIIGFRLSGLLQRFYKLKSAGRVQSSTLRMIVDRDKAIADFVPEEYWTITIEVVIDGKKYEAKLTKVDGKPFKCHSKEECDAIIARLPQELSVTSVSQVEKRISPKAPYKTSTLQQDAYSKLHFSNTRTQSVAQRLYEGLEVNGEHVGLITYMRTDSTSISQAFYTRHATPYILETYGKEYLGKLQKGKLGANDQGAHEAIRPTGTHRTPDVVAGFVGKDEAKLYRLIYCRAMASMMTPKVIEQTSVILSGNGLDFSLSGSRVIFKGYSIIYGDYEDKDEESLPPISNGDKYAIAKIEPEQKFTKPEPSYNYATIVAAMEDKGIGRPSTYATTIDTLKKRKYVVEVKGSINSTEEGRKLVASLGEYFPDIVSTDYTAVMEKQLDKVESGEETFLKAMNDFYIPFQENFLSVLEKIKDNPPEGEKTGEVCPICGRPLVIKKNRRGQPFVGCSGYPTCSYIKKEEKEPAKEVGIPCPDCGKPLLFRQNKKGETFIGCSNYPKCHYSCDDVSHIGLKKEPKAKKAPPTDYVKQCPKCKNGFLIIREGSKGKFLGCTNFPRCRYHEEWGEKK